jgi:hypothetical protein
MIGSVRNGDFARFFNWALRKVGHADLLIQEWAVGELPVVQLWLQRLRNFGFYEEGIFHFWNTISKPKMVTLPHQSPKEKGIVVLTTAKYAIRKLRGVRALRRG